MTSSGTPNQSWRKSSRSATQVACVEVAFTSNAVAVRDSKNPEGSALTVSRTAFARFLRNWA